MPMAVSRGIRCARGEQMARPTDADFLLEILGRMQ